LKGIDNEFDSNNTKVIYAKGKLEERKSQMKNCMHAWSSKRNAHLQQEPHRHAHNMTQEST
jgi:hypothetical protein